MVQIGSARLNESGKTTGGKAGDQTAREVSTQAWYMHIKGWIVRGQRIRRCGKDRICNGGSVRKRTYWILPKP